MTAPSGVLVVDKPRGPTSHDVVARVRRVLRTKSAGHAGTLDPMATGVLVVAIGEATKLVPYLTAADKSYEATLALGAATDTLDAEGTVTERVDVPRDWIARIDAAVAAELARIEQVPPAFSAIQKDGVRAYERARRGEVVELAARAVRVVDLTIASVREGGEGAPEVSIVVTAAKGYYVRSLARDLAAGLGTVGHLTSLRRTRSGAFAIDEAAPLDAPDLATRLLSVTAAAQRALPACRLTERGAIDARAGRAVAIDDAAPIATAHDAPIAPGPHAWLDATGELIAIGAIAEDGRLRVLRGFAPSG